MRAHVRAGECACVVCVTRHVAHAITRVRRGTVLMQTSGMSVQSVGSEALRVTRAELGHVCAVLFLHKFGTDKDLFGI